MIGNPSSNQDSTLFLYGPPGSGKTTVGQLLASHLDLPFIDLDLVISGQSGMSIPEIFSTEGEEGFRLRERQALEQILTPNPGIIALGGGTLLDPENRALVEARGMVVSLLASEPDLLIRLEADKSRRPLLGGDMRARLSSLMAERGEHYRSFQLQIDTSNMHPERIAWDIQIEMGRFWVEGMGGGYDVYVIRDGLSSIAASLQAFSTGAPVALVTDENVAAHYADPVQASLEEAGFRLRRIVIPPGESQKTMATVQQLWEAFLESGLERSSLVVALGGGVVGDLTGFAAATYLRGISWLLLPTTLLAMVDSSLGGKTGVDLPQGKNLVGAFHAPRLVVADPTTLATLPEAELRSGMAEVVKHGVIGDERLFEDCRQLADLRSGIAELIPRAMATKIKVIQADPYESDRRAALNLGHTIGHAVEVVSGYRLRHGEAIAIGLVAEARLSAQLNLADEGLADKIADCLRHLQLPTEIPADIDRQAVLRAMQVDKKKEDGRLRFALPVRIGKVLVGVEVKDLAERLTRTLAA